MYVCMYVCTYVRTYIHTCDQEWLLIWRRSFKRYPRDWCILKVISGQQKIFVFNNRKFNVGRVCIFVSSGGGVGEEIFSLKEISILHQIEWRFLWSCRRTRPLVSLRAFQGVNALMVSAGKTLALSVIWRCFSLFSWMIFSRSAIILDLEATSAVKLAELDCSSRSFPFVWSKKIHNQNVTIISQK